MSKCWYCNNELTTGDNPKHFGICNKCYDEMFRSGDTIIRSLTNKIADLEAKLAECEEKCKKAYQEGLLQKQFDKDMEIEQLKQQLAEKEKNALALFSALYDILEEQDPENVSSRIDYLTKQNNGAISDFYKEHKVLKQQLAEKDKEIITLNCVISEIHNDIKELHEFKVGEDEYDLTDSDARFSLQCDLLNNEQDKISFAVEQIQELKKFTEKEIKECNKLLQEELEDDYYIQSVNARQSMCYEFKREIDQQIKQLKEMK